MRYSYYTMEINKLEGETRDLANDNIEALKQIFPEAVTDGKVDVERLKELLGEEAEEGEERYSFTWPGKRDAIKLAISRNTGTLRPVKESSKDWDTTKNLFIEGDNLEVLRVLQNAYRGKVKMIYIDPPYNTGKDFVYKDDFKDNVANYKEQAGLAGQSNADTSGRYHTNWLNMMYPRLRLAKNLLKDDGVIFISIDDHEVHNLRKICDEIYGEDNFIELFSWQKTETPPNLSRLTKKSLEFILCYRKSNSRVNLLGLSKTSESSNGLMNQTNSVKTLIFPADKIDTGITDGVIKKGTYGTQSYEIELLEDTRVVNGLFTEPVVLKGKFKWSQDNLEKEISLGTALSIRTKTFSPSYERSDYAPEVPWNLIDRDFGVSTNESASQELSELFGAKDIFDHPKPPSLMRYIISFLRESKDEADIFLDFFAGSSATAHAVMQLNAEDGGKRRFIMVQLPEITSEDSAARKAGYETIAEIGRERIRRAAEKVKTDFAEKLLERETPLDVGFKAFSLDTTNFREWDNNTEDINASLLAALDTFKDGRDAEDALYEVLLKYGVDITEPLELLTIAGKTVYSLAGNYLLVCLEKKITLETVEEMAKLKPTRVVCYDDGFESDEVKQNALETLKRAGVEDVRVI